MRSRTKTWVASFCVLAGLFALVAIAHLPFARPLLARVLGRGGACPFGYDTPRTPEQLERSLHAYAALHRGEVPAHGRPALGFALGSESLAQVQAWASVHGMTCGQDSGGALNCDAGANSRVAAPPGLETMALWFHFGPTDTLVSVTAVRHAADAGALARGFDAERSVVEQGAGPVSGEQGSADPVTLASGALRQTSAEFRYRDYYALLRATNLGKDYVLTEEYHALTQ